MMNIPDVPLPPILRRAQQSWLWQVIGLPVSVGFGSAILVQGCLAHGFENLQRACVMAALDGTLVSFLTVVISGHSPGSPSFKSDGTVIEAAPKLKELADNAIILQQKANDPLSSVTRGEARDAAIAVNQIEAVVGAQNAMFKSTLKSEEGK
jgi:hypothetical protein